MYLAQVKKGDKFTFKGRKVVYRCIAGLSSRCVRITSIMSNKTFKVCEYENLYRFITMVRKAPRKKYQP